MYLLLVQLEDIEQDVFNGGSGRGVYLACLGRPHKLRRGKIVSVRWRMYSWTHIFLVQPHEGGKMRCFAPLHQIPLSFTREMTMLSKYWTRVTTIVFLKESVVLQCPQSK